MNLPEHHPHSAKFKVYDMHSHAYAANVKECEEWAARLKENNIERVVINTYASGEKFDELYDMYKGVSDVFEMWCGFDMSAWGTPECEEKAVASLVRDYEKGARGVGEVGDKGFGDTYFTNFATGVAALSEKDAEIARLKAELAKAQGKPEAKAKKESKKEEK